MESTIDGRGDSGFATFLSDGSWEGSVGITGVVMPVVVDGVQSSFQG